MSWEGMVLKNAVIKSLRGEPLVLKYPGISSAVVFDEEGEVVEVVKLGADLLYFATQQGKVYKVVY